MKLQTKIKIIRWVEKLLKTEIPVSILTKPVEIQYRNFPIVRIQQSISILRYENTEDTLKRHKEVLQDRIWDVIQHAISYHMIVDSDNSKKLQASIWIVDRHNQNVTDTSILDRQKDTNEILAMQKQLYKDMESVGKIVTKNVMQDKNKEPLDTPPDNE